MFGLETLDVLIGLMTVYFMFGIACTAIVEAISAWASIRSQNLETALKELFSGDLAPGQPFITKFFEHPLIQSLSKGENGRPSYIPPDLVARVVEALIVGRAATATLAAGVQLLPDTVDKNRIKGILETLVTQTGNDAARFRYAVAKLFDAVMDRASGWYKRRMQTTTLIVAAVLVLSGNIDSINLSTLLASNPDTRAKLVAIAHEKVTNELALRDKAKGDSVQQAEEKVKIAETKYDSAVSELQSAGFTLGWKEYPHDFIGWLTKVAGLLVTIFAVSLGGPFWFDILQRVMQVRSTGPKPSPVGK
ncbi:MULTISPECIES: hypothetical protein [Buttiauxella]|uniref:hypothetical protein n=1 Tax=Buttiauxella TaxID=82976 RepID=UPI001EDBBC2E|nr:MULTISPECIES: hypothetical protein [Buttiauxella]UNK63442.1 hypothetical protein MNO13_11360 [Buttiauxella ferragutiae]